MNNKQSCNEMVLLIKKGRNSNWKKALGIMVDEHISVYDVEDAINSYCNGCGNSRGCNCCNIYAFQQQFKYE